MRRYHHYRKKEAKPMVKKASRNYFLKRRKKIKKIILFILFILIFIALFYFLFYSPVFKVREIVIQRQENIYYEVSNQELKDNVSQLLNQKRFLIFFQKNLFFFSKKSAKKIIEKKLFVEEIKITKKISGKVKIQIQDKLPVVAWQWQEKFYYLDSQGKIIKEITEEKLDKKMPFIYFKNYRIVKESDIDKESENLEPEKNLESGGGETKELSKPNKIEELSEPDKEEVPKTEEEKQFSFDFLLSRLTSEKIDFILQISKQLEEKVPEIKILAFEIIDPLTKDVNIYTSRGFFLYFDQGVNLEKQINNLILALDQKLKDKNLEYIDLRYEERIYYKEKRLP